VPVVGDDDAEVAAVARRHGGVARLADQLAPAGRVGLADEGHRLHVVDMREGVDQGLADRADELHEAQPLRVAAQPLEKGALGRLVAGADRPQGDAAAVGEHAPALELGGVLSH